MFQYRPTLEKLSKAEGDYITYGITVYDGPHKVALVSDVSTRFSFVFSLCIKFTAHQLSPMHLMDVLEDILSSLGQK